MNTGVQKIINEVSNWNGVTTSPHRFGGVEFTIGKVEIGHIHNHGMVDIPFTVALREQLVADGEAGVHHLLRESGWITFYLDRTGTVSDALRLYRLSYLQKTARRNADLVDDFATELESLNFSAPINDILKRLGGIKVS
ncbi:MAG: DUF5519 family protein [Aggregatilineales bacterium]